MSLEETRKTAEQNASNINYLTGYLDAQAGLPLRLPYQQIDGGTK